MIHPITKLLLQKQSKRTRDKIIEYVCSNPVSIDVLMDCFRTGDTRMSQNASWPLTVLSNQKPELLTPYIDEFIATLKPDNHSGITRNMVRIMQTANLSEKQEGQLYDICFGYLNDPKVPVAIRVFSMTVLTNIAMNYPELKEELKITISLYYPDGSSGYKSRAKKEIKRLSSR